MTTSSPLQNVLQVLRAAAEGTRLRLLVVCSDGELTVGELCQVVRQSQPRVSRHLKLLCDAGLLVRFREGHCVYYRTPVQGPGVEVVKQLLTWTDGSDATLKRDRERSIKVRTRRGALATRQLKQADAESPSLLASENEIQAPLGELLRQETTEKGPIGDLLDIGTGTGRILRWLAPDAQQAIGVDISPEALRIARTSVHGAGLRHCVLQLGDMYALPFPPQSFDTVTLDRVLSEAKSPEAVLEEAVRQLRPAGRLVLIDDYDKLESDAAGGGNALQTLRRWLQDAGLQCERLRPIETATQHLILAVGRLRPRLSVAA